IDLAQLVVADAHALQRAEAKVLNDNVADGCQFPYDFLRSRRLEIESDAALVAIHREVVGALGPVPGRTPGASVVSLTRLFNLDDLGAEVAQHHRAVGAGQDS